MRVQVRDGREEIKAARVGGCFAGLVTGAAVLYLLAIMIATLLP